MKHTVLVIEDEEELRESMRDALEFEGYDVAVASDGADAFAQIGALEHLCLILLDLLMPGMDGWDFFERLRQRPEYSKVPVVVHTSAPSRAPGGAALVLQKPVQIERLLAVAKKYC